MPSWLEGHPFLVTVAILFGIVLLRAQATYWAGRAAARGVSRTRWGRTLDGPRMARATASLNRWGLPIITVSFVTVGFQTVVNAAAGVMRVRWLRYTAAMVPGCALWALLYGTVGFAALTAWFRLDGAWQWVAAAVLVIVVAGGIAIASHVRRRSTITSRPSPASAAR